MEKKSTQLWFEFQINFFWCKKRNITIEFLYITKQCIYSQSQRQHGTAFICEYTAGSCWGFHWPRLNIWKQTHRDTHNASLYAIQTFQAHTVLLQGWRELWVARLDWSHLPWNFFVPFSSSRSKLNTKGDLKTMAPFNVLYFCTKMLLMLASMSVTINRI